jgi:hypothetical protein
MMVGAVAALLAAMVGVRYLARHRGLRVRREGLRLKFTLAERPVKGQAHREADGDPAA